MTCPFCVFSVLYTHKTKGAIEEAQLDPCKLTEGLYQLGSLWELPGIESLAPR